MPNYWYGLIRRLCIAPTPNAHLTFATPPFFRLDLLGDRRQLVGDPTPNCIQRPAPSAQRAARNAHFAFATTLLILFLRPVPFKVYGDLMSTINSPFDIMPTKCAAPGYNFYDQEFAQTLGTPS